MHKMNFMTYHKRFQDFAVRSKVSYETHNLQWYHGPLLYHAASLPLSQMLLHSQPGGGRGTSLYGLYWYIQPQRVWVFSCFGSKWGIEFWPKLGMGFGKQAAHPHPVFLRVPLPLTLSTC